MYKILFLGGRVIDFVNWGLYIGCTKYWIVVQGELVLSSFAWSEKMFWSRKLEILIAWKIYTVYLSYLLTDSMQDKANKTE